MALITAPFRLLAAALAVLAAGVGAVRVVLKLAGFAALLAIVGVTVGALTVGVQVLHALVLR